MINTPFKGLLCSVAAMIVLPSVCLAEPNIVFRYSKSAIEAQGGLAISDFTVPDLYTNEPISLQLSAAGVIEPLHWTYVGGLPVGLNFSTNGRLQGTPTDSGNYSGIIFRVRDANDNTGSVGPFTLSVYDQPADGVLNEVLPYGENFSHSITVIGGKSPYSYSIENGRLPGGITISGNQLSGIPNEYGTFTPTLLVRDANGYVANINALFTVYDELIASASFNDGYVGENYSAQFGVTGGSGHYQWIANGSLPGSLALTSTGVVSGVFGAAGQYAINALVSDGNTSDTVSATIDVYAMPQLGGSSYPDPYVGTAYSSVAPTLTGGKGPSTWSATGLPSGLSINSSNGLISGNISSAAASSATITVTDANSRTATRSLGFTPRAALVAINNMPSTMNVGVSVTAQMSGSGGKTTYTYSASGLPNGLSINDSGRVTGTPTTVGTASVVIIVRDQNLVTATASKTVSVQPPDCSTGPVGTVCADGAIYAGALGGVRRYAAPVDEDPMHWNNGASAGSITTAATSFTDGLANTDALVGAADAEAPYTAALVCRAKGSQWYLPAKDELNLLYNKMESFGGGINPTGPYFWTSSEYNYGMVTINRNQASTGSAKNVLRPARCFRR